MKAINQAKSCVPALLLILSILASCSNILHLNVDYRLPAATEALKGRKVFLVFDDIRTNKDVIGPRARAAYHGVSENVSLSWAGGPHSTSRVGVYELPALFTEVFKRRLKQAGAEVVTSRGGAEVEMWILLEDFLLDLDRKTWKARMTYEGRLVKDERILSRQRVGGEAERLRLIGQNEADRMLGEFFTDAINRLDFVRLFEQASL